MSVAMDTIDMLAEYPVGARLPLTDRISYSIGAWQDDVVMSVSLAPLDGVPSARTTTGLVLVTPGTPIRWAFEIVASVGVVEI
ncbi:MAG TPA: hypothetical protein VLM79_33240, partial [Kofleriaceae bacterium]|nr:hypothetical protein [Kofleriaceae bacterium]